MPNTCTICKHPEREQIESALARGQSLRDIAGQFEASKSSVFRHHRCIAGELQALKAAQTSQLNETLLERLNRYRLVAEKHLKDDDKALAALDRCYKHIDIEAKLTGEYQKKQENKLDAPNRNEIILEAYALLFASRTLDESLEQLHAIYNAPDEASRRDAIQAAIDDDAAAVGEVWDRATEIVSKRVM